MSICASTSCTNKKKYEKSRASIRFCYLHRILKLIARKKNEHVAKMYEEKIQKSCPFPSPWLRIFSLRTNIRRERKEKIESKMFTSISENALISFEHTDGHKTQFVPLGFNTIIFVVVFFIFCQSFLSSQKYTVRKNMHDTLTILYSLKNVHFGSNTASITFFHHYPWHCKCLIKWFFSRKKIFMS